MRKRLYEPPPGFVPLTPDEDAEIEALVQIGKAVRHDLEKEKERKPTQHTKDSTEKPIREPPKKKRKVVVIQDEDEEKDWLELSLEERLAIRMDAKKQQTHSQPSSVVATEKPIREPPKKKRKVIVIQDEDEKDWLELSKEERLAIRMDAKKQQTHSQPSSVVATPKQCTPCGQTTLSPSQRIQSSHTKTPSRSSLEPATKSTTTVQPQRVAKITSTSALVIARLMHKTPKDVAPIVTPPAHSKEKQPSPNLTKSSGTNLWLDKYQPQNEVLVLLA